MSNTNPVLYSFRRCPYAMRARMGVYYAGIATELREVVLRDKPAEMLEASPKGTVPVLILPDETVIDESLDIMRWALTQNDPDGWLSADQNQTAMLITRNDGDFKKALDRYKYPNRYPDEDCSGAQKQCEEVLTDLNERLSQHKQLCANHITLADIALFPFIRQCANTNRDWFDSLPLPHLQTWLDNHIQSKLFENIMEKYVAWVPTSDPVYFGHDAL